MMVVSELMFFENLDGFRVCIGYMAKLTSRYVGYFPARITKTKRVFVCLSEELLNKALRIIGVSRYETDRMILIVNEKRGVAFNLDMLNSFQDKKGDLISLKILTDEMLQGMSRGDLEWTPGFVSEELSPNEVSAIMRTRESTGASNENSTLVENIKKAVENFPI